MVGAGPELREPVALSFDPSARRAHVLTLVERGPQLWIPEHQVVDVETGHRAIASVRALGDGPALTAPAGVAMDAANDRTLVIDRRSGLVAVDRTTGDRTLVGDPPIGDVRPFHPADMALDEKNDRALVIDAGGNALLSIDLGTGEDAIIEGIGPELSHMTGVALDAANDRALLTGYWGGEGPSMIAMDLSNGDRTVLIDETVGMEEDLLILQGVAIDAAARTALVISDWSSSLVALDLVTGDRTVIASDAVGTGPPLSNPRAVVFDPSEERAIVMSGSFALVAVELDGERTIVSDAETGGPRLVRATDVATSSARSVWVVDEGLDALLLVDLVTGQRVIASGHTPH
jgi:hypothetical protein